MTPMARMKDDRFRYSGFGFQMTRALQHRFLISERCRSFRVIRVFRGCPRRRSEKQFRPKCASGDEAKWHNHRSRFRQGSQMVIDITCRSSSQFRWDLYNSVARLIAQVVSRKRLANGINRTRSLKLDHSESPFSCLSHLSWLFPYA
jgi:hypothetical protein